MLVGNANRVDDFLNSLQRKGTRDTYGAGIRSYFRHIGILPEEYFVAERDHEALMDSWVSWMTDEEGKNMPSLTVRSYANAVRQLLLENDIELSQRFWKKRVLGRTKGGAVSQDEVPIRDTTKLRQIFSHMDIHCRALFLCMASSGMRIGETLKLTLDDVEGLERQGPAIVHIRKEYTKGRRKRIAFFSTEAKEVLNQWIRQREAYIQASIGKAKSIRKYYEKKGWRVRSPTLDDRRLFPFTESTAFSQWNNALRKAGLEKKDKQTGHRTLHPHILRKRVRTILGRIDTDISEQIIGHEGYLTKEYRHNEAEEMFEFYSKNEHKLFIFASTVEEESLRQELEVLKKKTKSFDRFVNLFGAFMENLEYDESAPQELKEMKQLALLLKQTHV